MVKNGYNSQKGNYYKSNVVETSKVLYNEREKSMQTHQPHDKFFKETFSDLELTRDFIRHYLPGGLQPLIDLSTLSQVSESFVDDALKAFYSDMLFRVNTAEETCYIYFLFEHKSYQDPLTAFQLYKYMGAIWDRHLKNHGGGRLPVVLPILIYHGDRPFEGAVELVDLVEGFGDLPHTLREAIPNFKLCLLDLSHLSDAELKGHVRLQMFMRLARDVFSKDKDKLVEDVERAVFYLSRLSGAQMGINHFKTYIHYIFNTQAPIGKEEVMRMIKKTDKLYPEGSDVIMTYAEHLIKEGYEEGVEEGIQKGKAEGKAEGKAQMLVSAFNMKFGSQIDEKLVAKIYKLTSNQMDGLLKKLFELNAVQELEVYLESIGER